MTCLNRTDLTILQKIQCSIQALLAQLYGGMSHLSREFNLSRPTLYASASTVKGLLETHFSQGAIQANTLVVDEAQLRRAVLALRVVAPNSIRAIETLIPLIYPGQSVSFGQLQSWLVEAQEKAEQFNHQVDLSGIRAGALDEMFSQGDPVLAGVDLEGGYLFSLEVHESRSGENWQQVLQHAKEQGLNLEVVVKDAALGIANGVSEVFPKAEQRDDSFHALYELGKVHHQLEQKAYSAIAAEDDALKKLGKIQGKEKEKRQAARKKLKQAQQTCQQRIEEFDCLEQASHQVTHALQWIDLQTGQWQTGETVKTTIQQAADQMSQIPHKKCRSVATYLHNRAPGLALYADALDQQLQTLQQKTHYPKPVLSLACVIVQLVHYLKETSLSDKQCLRFQKQCLGAWHLLEQQLPKSHVNQLLDTVQMMWQQRHRASSAIEGFNSALRPFLYVQKRATQGFLNVFRAYFNLRTRRSGRHKGTSAYEKITGTKVGDWLSLLGYPPTAQT